MAGVLVHEWIAQSGGSENVLQAMSEVFPDADIVCLWNDSVGRFDPQRLRETWLARSPLRRSKAAAMPFMLPTWQARRDHDYDWALISSHLFAHHARFRPERPDFRRFVYVHTPARYIWAPEMDGRGQGRAARAVGRLLKPIDAHQARRPARWAANSAFVRQRMHTTWGVESEVIHPPVEVSAIQAVPDWGRELDGAEADRLAEVSAAVGDGFVLGASRFIPYKRLDLVIRAGELADRPVVLAGRGPEEESLRRVAATARVPVHFVDHPSTALLRAIYQRAGLFVFPAVEDFGIMPVEAMAAGAPVLAQAVGGTAESVQPGRTGALSRFESSDEIRAGITTALGTRREDRLDRARDFSAERFATRLSEWMEL